jgi:hypothetical protein
MIFKQGSCEQELFEGMQNAQQESLIQEVQHQDQLVFAAMQELNNAAEAFERVGRKVRAEEVTAVMVSLAESSDNDIQKLQKPARKRLLKHLSFSDLILKS